MMRCGRVDRRGWGGVCWLGRMERERVGRGLWERGNFGSGRWRGWKVKWVRGVSWVSGRVESEMGKRSVMGEWEGGK